MNMRKFVRAIVNAHRQGNVTLLPISVKDMLAGCTVRFKMVGSIPQE